MKIYKIREDAHPFIFVYIIGMMIALSIFKMLGVITVSWIVVFLGPLIFIGCVSTSIIIVMIMFCLVSYGNQK